MSKKRRNQSPPNPGGQSRPTGTAGPRTWASPSEEAEPVAERRPVPIFLIVLLALLIYAGDMYIMDHGADVMGKAGPFPAIVSDPFTTYGEVLAANPETEGEKLIRLGKGKFELICAPCHQSTGVGNPATGIPPLCGSEWVKTPGPGRAIRIVLNSVRGPIQVIGKTYDNPSMPPWGPQLTDEDIALILSYVRANQDWGNKAPVVKPEVVKQVREATASRNEQWTADALAGVPDTE